MIYEYSEAKMGKGCMAVASTRYIGLIKKVLKGSKSKKQSLMKLKREIFGLPSQSKIDLALTLNKVPNALKLIKPNGECKVVNGSGDFSNLGIEFNLFSLISEIQDNPNLIRDFEKTKENIENNIVKGRLDKCDSELDKFESLYGASFWSIDVRLSLKNRIKSADDIIEYLKNKVKDEKELNFLNILFYKHSLSNMDAFMKNYFIDIQKEYKNNGMAGYIDMLSALVLPFQYDEKRDVDKIVELVEVLSPLDRYVLLIKVFIEYICKGEESKYHQVYVQFMEKMNETLGDSYWGRLIKIYNKEIISDYSPSNIDLINKYSAGRYSDVILDDLCVINRDLSFMDIKSKALIYTYGPNSDIDEKVITSTFEKHLLGHFNVLHTNTSRYNSVVEFIEELNFRYYSLDFIKSVRPSIYSSYPFINKKIYYRSCIESYVLGFNITPRHFYQIFSTEKEKYAVDESLYTLSPSRILRCEIQNAIESKKINLVEDLVSKLSTFDDVTKSEINHLISMAYLKNNDWFKLVSLVSKECINEYSNIILYPLKEIVERIELDNQLSISINAINCVYLYTIARDSEYRVKVSELLEDYLLHMQVQTPSELLLERELNLEDVATFNFFFKVCSVDIMSDLICFTSGKELLLERLKILKILMKDSTDEVEEFLQQEEVKILNEILAHSLTAQHKKNKLYINIDGIKKSQINEYKVRFENILIFKDMDMSVLEVLFDDIKTEEDSSNKQNNMRRFIFESIYQKVIHDFIVDGNHGLARSLSSEIRHGVLPNKLRSVFEGLNLVTVLDLEGKYEDNDYWREYLEKLASEDFVNYIDNVLKELSGSVDSLISKANRWPTISEDFRDNVSIFNFSLTNDSLTDFSNYLEDKIDKLCISDVESLRDKDVIELIDCVEEYVWHQLNKCFLKIKKLLNEELKEDFNELIRNTRNKISVNGLNLAKLNENLSKANAHIIKEISEVESWFSKPNSELEGDFYLTDILSSSIDCIKGIYNPKVININRSGIYIKPSDKIYTAREALGIVRALISIYQNCLSHGINGNDTIINIEIENNRDVLISNKVDQLQINHISEYGYVDKVDNFSVDSDYDKLIGEGGTGLYKIFRNLIDSSSEFDFKIELKGETFYQRIII